MYDADGNVIVKADHMITPKMSSSYVLHTGVEVKLRLEQFLHVSHM